MDDCFFRGVRDFFGSVRDRPGINVGVDVSTRWNALPSVVKKILSKNTSLCDGTHGCSLKWFQCLVEWQNEDATKGGQKGFRYSFMLFYAGRSHGVMHLSSFYPVDLATVRGL